MSPRERDEQFLDTYLEGDSELSRLYRRGAELQPETQPGAQLDARIRAEARRAVAPAARVVHSPFARHWMIPTSLAAVFVLSVSVVLLVPEPDGEPGGVQDDAPRLQQVPAPSSAAPRAPSDTSRQQSSGSEEKRKALRAKQPETDREALQVAPQPAAAGLAEEAGAAAPGEPSPAAALPPRPSASQSVRDDPQAWLRHIEALLDARREAQAKSDLRAFVHRYPDVPLPERLAHLAASMDSPRP